MGGQLLRHTHPILENLKQDESLYARKSVANHINDFSKDSLARIIPCGIVAACLI